MNFIRTSDNYYPVFMWQILQMFPNLTPADFVSVSYHDGINNGEYLPVFNTDMPADSPNGVWVEDIPAYDALAGKWCTTWKLKLHDTYEMQEALAAAKLQKKAALAEKRWQVETAGINVNGFIIKTDRESQTQITCAMFAIERGYLTHVNWKGENGWIEMDTSVVANLPPLVSDYVQLCFQKEKQMCDIIDSINTIEELNNIDLEVGWPTGVYEINTNTG